MLRSQGKISTAQFAIFNIQYQSSNFKYKINVDFECASPNESPVYSLPPAPCPDLLLSQFLKAVGQRRQGWGLQGCGWGNLCHCAHVTACFGLGPQVNWPLLTLYHHIPLKFKGHALECPQQFQGPWTGKLGKRGPYRILQNSDHGHYLWEFWFTMYFYLNSVEQNNLLCHMIIKVHENNTQRNSI